MPEPLTLERIAELRELFHPERPDKAEIFEVMYGDFDALLDAAEAHLKQTAEPARPFDPEFLARNSEQVASMPNWKKGYRVNLRDVTGTYTVEQCAVCGKPKPCAWVISHDECECGAEPARPEGMDVAALKDWFTRLAAMLEGLEGDQPAMRNMIYGNAGRHTFETLPLALAYIEALEAALQKR